ncbi:MAG: hypothetical protein AAF411_01545 [Myxococcota bacterium]
MVRRTCCIGLIVVLGCGSSSDSEPSDPAAEAPFINREAPSINRGSSEDHVVDRAGGEANVDTPETLARQEEPDALAEPAAPSQNVANEDTHSAAGEEAGEEATRQMVANVTEVATAAEIGSTRCESAYRGLVAMLEAAAEQYPDRVREAPDEGAFISMCEELPEAVQRCLLPSYATTHGRECAEHTARLSPAQTTAIRDVFGPR